MPLKDVQISKWTKFSRIVTCCIPGTVIKLCCGKKGPLDQQGTFNAFYISSMEGENYAMPHNSFHDVPIVHLHSRNGNDCMR